MGVNGYQGSIRAKDQDEGVFKANQQIMTLIGQLANVEVQSLEKFILYSVPGTQFKLNDETFEMGQTHMYEAWHAEVSSIKFIEDSPPQTTIDFIIKKHDPFG